MSYPRLEIGYDFGASFVTSFKTVVIELGNGTEQRLAQYQSPLAQIQFGDRNLSTHQMHQSFQYLQQFLRERKGSQEAFAVRDWSDYEVEKEPCRRLTSTTYLFEKVYGDLACPVRLPIVSTLEIFVNNTKLTSGYSVNTDEGIITFTTAKNVSDTITWSGVFDRLCRFLEDKIEVRNLGYSPEVDVHILQISSLRARESPNKYPPRIVPYSEQESGVLYRVTVEVDYIDGFGYRQKYNDIYLLPGKIYNLKITITNRSQMSDGRWYLNTTLSINLESNPDYILSFYGWIEGSETVRIVNIVKAP